MGNGASKATKKKPEKETKKQDVEKPAAVLLSLFRKDPKEMKDKGNFERVLGLLEKYADDNNDNTFLKEQDTYTGETILHFCLKLGHVYLLKKLMENFDCYKAFHQ